MSIITGIIEDGYEVPIYYKAVENSYPEIHLSYRPPLPEEIARFSRVNKDVASVSLTEAAASLVQAHLVSWDLKKKSGDVAPISLDIIKRLHTSLRVRLLCLMLGTDMGDEETKPPQLGADLKN